MQVTVGLLTQIYELNKQGKNDKEIAADLGIAHSTAQKCRKQLGLKSPARNWLTEEELSTIYRMAEEGKPDSEIAATIGRGISTVDTARRRLRVPRQKKRYAVFNRRTNELLCVGNAYECAAKMGWTYKSFWTIKSQANHGARCKYLFVEQ